MKSSSGVTLALQTEAQKKKKKKRPIKGERLNVPSLFSNTQLSPNASLSFLCNFSPGENERRSLRTGQYTVGLNLQTEPPTNFIGQLETFLKKES